MVFAFAEQPDSEKELDGAESAGETEGCSSGGHGKVDTVAEVEM